MSVGTRPSITSAYIHPFLTKWKAALFILLMVSLSFQPSFALTGEEIQKFQTQLRSKPVGERIAFWAKTFIGVPYDTDPLGEYVSRATIVSDERVDCMYLTFRAAELALSLTPGEAIDVALDRRFHSKGVLKDGRVVNYEDRFEYGEDMIESGKWGEEITASVGNTMQIKGSRGRDVVQVLSSDALKQGTKNLKSGDLVFFAKKPERREVGEIIGHIGIVEVAEVEGSQRRPAVFLIHASGTKGKGGAVKRVLLKEYLSRMPFVGVKITRFR